MTATNPVRSAQPSDLEAIRGIVDVALFPGELLDEVIAPYFDAPSGDEQWLVYEAAGELLGVAYYTPEPLTEGTWNLKAIAVVAEQRGRGVGRALLSSVESNLTEKGQRLLIVETSSDDEQIAARAFYERTGYRLEACIENFWAKAEDKLVFTKSLRAG